ncbi:MAG TPA: cytochrome c oxidase subunit II [Candidatus Krumholzibacteria bacterium]|nr:cytochrome c oxidase subunit II [Candidatus Krumholzibacteria bacterium]
MLSRFSTTSDAVNGPIILISAVSLFLLIGITLVMIFFALKYNRKRRSVGEDVHGHKMLEIVWTVIPTILAFGFFWYGWEGYRLLKSPPADSIQVHVTGRMWSWNHEYANGVQSPELYVPVDKPVKINLTSQDVIHSYFIPAFKVKQDAVPGVPNLFLWFQATTVGDYDIFCAEYCGTRHSAMLSKVHVLPQEEFDAWLASEGEKVVAMEKAAESAEGDDAGLAILGKQLAQAKGCAACHSVDGSKLIGPSFKGIYGHQVTVVTGGSERDITVDDEYIKHSMLEPTADIVKGYQPLMPSQKGLVTDAEIKALTAYIKSLN